MPFKKNSYETTKFNCFETACVPDCNWMVTGYVPAVDGSVPTIRACIGDAQDECVCLAIIYNNAQTARNA